MHVDIIRKFVGFFVKFKPPRIREKSIDNVPKTAIHYLETSGVNYLADNMKDFEFNSHVQKAMQVDLCISSVTLWEILLNTNDERKDYLIYWMQFNCANYLLKSPSEIVIDFINRGLPRKERLLFAEDPETRLGIGATWKNIHGRIDRTIPVDIEEIRNYSQTIREFSNIYSRVIDDMVAVKNINDPFHQMMLSLQNPLKEPSDYESAE